MAKKEEKPHAAHGVYVANGKYHCAECDHEMEVEEVCPSCKKEFDWARIKATIPLKW